MAVAQDMAKLRSTSSTAPVVAAERLTKVFRDFWMRPRARAVDEITFESRPKEIFGLLGPNGSGKSTTIKMILGLLRPTRGRLVVFGKPASDVATKKRIGFLPEESYFYGFLNARETLDYYGKLFGLARAERTRRTDELLEMVGLVGAQYRPIREYSKGMQRRIGIAQALINDPEFLILDEPTTGLDPLGTRQVKDLIIELGRRGKTILLSSHLLADVEDVVDRMIILYGGQIREEGPRDELLLEHSRTTIQTDALDDATIAEIDEVLRRRSGGQRAILEVSHPRQKLEDKFLDIVRKAREANIKTSGAGAEGAMAGFLKAAPLTGGQLIDNLVSAADDPPPPEVESAAPAVEEPRDDVIRSLVSGDDDDDAGEGIETPAAGGDKPDALEPEEIRIDQLVGDRESRARVEAPETGQKRSLDSSEVDMGVIGSLLDSDDSDRADESDGGEAGGDDDNGARERTP